MTRALLNQIEIVRQSRPLSIVKIKGRRLKIDNAPPTKSHGLYWLFTNYSIAELKSCTKSTDKGATDIGFLAALHENFAHISTITNDGFMLVYNGMAGKSCGLRERIHQQFNGGKGTGCLSILRSSLNDLNRWRVSYVILQVSKSQTPDVSANYEKHAKDLERIWRLQYGWPLLCKI